MTAEEQKDAAGVKIFPPALPLLIVLSGVALQSYWPLSAEWILPAPARHWVGGAIILIAVLGLGVWSIRTMRSTGQNENPYEPTTEIVANGPFAFTRNPMYLQMVLICLGFAVLLANAWLLALTPICAILLYLLVIRYEEAYLERKFGQQYLDYKARVRRWI